MAKAIPESRPAAAVISSAKVKKLIIRNFRCIGKDPVEIDLDDIVVLVGPNNAGKSTILKAYNLVMKHGSKEDRLGIDDFPSERIDPDNLPEIELQTYLFDNFPDQKWLHKDTDGVRSYIRERWRWHSIDTPPKRQGHNADLDDWAEQVPWGAPGVARGKRPTPHLVDAFASPDKQGSQIEELLCDILRERAQQSAEGSAPPIQDLIERMRILQRQIVDASAADIQELQNSLSSQIKNIFAGMTVTLDARPDDISEKSLVIFQNSPTIRMGQPGGHMAPLSKQGSGARRTLLWSALRILAERPMPPPKNASKPAGKKAVAGLTENLELAFQAPHILLLDEPEICLHPSAVRDACKVLYDLASGENAWQVMVTTHSPAFIDISRDNTTVVRVEQNSQGQISGTTVFRPEKVALTQDEKASLKIMNQWDPYFAEFLFGGRTIIVEGDTEYSAFREIIESDREHFRDVHVLRARGKFIIPIIARIMNQFGGRYSVLHDTDQPTTSQGRANGAWAANEQIRLEIEKAPDPTRVRLAASLIDFEHAIFGEAATSDKPFYTVEKIRNSPKHKAIVKKVLEFLLFERNDTAPAKVITWNNIDQLKDALASKG